MQVHLLPPPFSHAKLFVIDGEYAQIGSVNLDTRSLRLNFEIALEVFDSGLCGELTAFITGYRKRVAALSAAELARVPPLQRIRNSLCWLVSPYL
jgi:cardiolipin synthase